MIEQELEILLIDPWFEGCAFYNGWSLLDKQLSNESIIKYLKQSNKNIYIWYSHEHSDHFSISFLKAINQIKQKVSILFQKTIDCRVLNFLKKQGFEVIECLDGIEVRLNKKFKITTWKYRDGDSFCLIKSNSTWILNTNDCVISTQELAKLVSNKINAKTTKVDILFAQFGYANWIGNELDFELRKKVAIEKLERIKLQAELFTPSMIIPFASFAYFCHSENFYLNDEQNSPNSLRTSELLNTRQENIYFMKPLDTICISNDLKNKNKLNALSQKAEKHWEILKENIRPDKIIIVNVEKIQITDIFNSFRRRMTINFLFLPQILELCGIIKPLRVLINDINSIAEISYINGISFKNNLNNWDISLTSEVLEFIFKNEFGFNTTSVNGRYRTQNLNKNTEFGKFFVPQEYYKNGHGIFHPISSSKVFFCLLIKLLQNYRKPKKVGS